MPSRLRRGLAAIASLALALALALVARPAAADGVYVPVPARVVYCSLEGVPQIADLANPQAGPDGGAVLQKLCNLNAPGQKYAGQPLEIIVDIPVLCRQVKVYSLTTIRGLGNGRGLNAAAGLWMSGMAAGSTDNCILRNANWRSNYNAGNPAASPLTPANIVDHDIAIRDLHLDGQRRNGASNNTSGLPQLNSSGVIITPIAFFGVQDILVDNVDVYDPCGFHMTFTNVNRGTFRNLFFCDPTYAAGTWSNPSRNTDGLHFVGPLLDILVDGLFGSTGDDMLAFNLADGGINPDPTWGNLFGGTQNVYYGNGSRLTARNLYPVNCADVLRVLLGSASGGPGACTGDQIQVTHVAGSVVQGPAQCETWSGAGSGGTVHRATFRDWQLDLLDSSGSAPPCGWQFGKTWDDVLMENFQFRNVQGGSIAHQVNFEPGCTMGRLVIAGYSIRGDSSEAASVLPAISIRSAVLDELRIEGSGWYRNAATDVAFATVNGSTVNRLSLSGVSGNNLTNLLSFTGSNVIGQVDSGPVCHRNPYTSGAAGGAAINVGTGITIPYLTAIGSDTAALLGTSAGTVTAKKTDLTERGN